MSAIVDFAWENGLVDPQQKKIDGLPPSSKPYIRFPTPTYLYQCNNMSNLIQYINMHACAVNNWQHVRL